MYEILSVDIESKDFSMDGFIDYIITLTINVPNLADWAKNEALLVIYTILRPLQISDPPPQSRKPPLDPKNNRVREPNTVQYMP